MVKNEKKYWKLYPIEIIIKAGSFNCTILFSNGGTL